MRETVERPAALVDVTGLSAEIEETDDGGLLIGAAARNTAVAEHPAVRDALSDARARDRGRRLGADPQHGDGRRQPAAAHPLHLLLRHRRLALQQARPRARAATRSRASTASTRSSAPRPRAWPPTRRTCASRSPRWTPSCTFASAAGERTVAALPTCTGCPGIVPRSRRCCEPGELITAVELPAAGVRRAFDLPQGARPRQLRLRARLGRRGARARRRTRSPTCGSRSAASPPSRGGRGAPRRRCEAGRPRETASVAAAEAELADARPLADNAFKVELDPPHASPPSCNELTEGARR